MKEYQDRKTFYSQRFYQNVKLMAKEKGIKMKDIEKYLGVCSGYFSRNRKNNNVAGIDKAFILAEFFGVTVEELLSDTLEKKLKAPAVKADLLKAITRAEDVFSREEIIQIIRESPP